MNVIELYNSSAIQPMDLDINTWVASPSAVGKKEEAAKRIQAAIMELDLFNLELNSLPKEVWQLTHLITLYLNQNSFYTLPAELGQLTNLTQLHLDDSRLRILPPEIGRLTSLIHLNLGGNTLRSLPTEIGLLVNLSELMVSNNGLTSLPQEIGNLINLANIHLYNNRDLQELPLSIGQIPNLTFIDIGRTKLNYPVRDAILKQCEMMRAGEAIKVLPHRLAKWAAFAKCAVPAIESLTDSQKITLNEWLVRLEKTQDFVKNQSALAKTVCSIVADAIRNKDFQELFFSQAAANNACCEDRAAMALNEIYTSWNILCKSADLSLLTGVAKTLRLRKALQKLIRKEEGESVEIFLYYESTLKKQLKLTTAIENMAYETIGNRRWIDPEILIADVNAHFFEELFEVPLFQKIFTENRKEELEKINAEFHPQLSECPPGDPNDEIVLNHQARQGEIMGEWKMKIMQLAKEWYQT